MLMIRTTEVSVDFTGFPLSVTYAASGGDTSEIAIDAAERDDGAVPQRLNLRGRTEDLVRIFREALTQLEGD